jgi:hypothetical protein
MYKRYLPVIVAALAIIIIGCLNPKPLQTVKNDKPTGCPNYIWLAVISMMVGIAVCYLIKMQKVPIAK